MEDAQKILGKTALDVFDMHEPYVIPVPEAPKRPRRRQAKAAAI